VHGVNPSLNRYVKFTFFHFPTTQKKKSEHTEFDLPPNALIASPVHLALHDSEVEYIAGKVKYDNCGNVLVEVGARVIIDGLGKGVVTTVNYDESFAVMLDFGVLLKSLPIILGRSVRETTDDNLGDKQGGPAGLSPETVLSMAHIQNGKKELDWRDLHRIAAATLDAQVGCLVAAYYI
jgi:hypothetical protein